MGTGGGNVPYFEFPPKEPLNIRLKDILEEKVDEKYYLKDYQIENILKSDYNQNLRRIQEKDWRDTLCARDWKDPKCVQVSNLKGENTEPKIEEKNKLRIRKLTPKECWRLMSFDDEDFEKAQAIPMSNTQLYKQARK